MTHDAHTPRRFYGWTMLAIAIGMAIATMPGQTVLVSLYKDRIGESLGIGLTAVAGAYMVGTVLAGLPLPFVGRCADRFGLRVTVLTVALAFAGVLALTRFVDGIITLTLAFFCIRFLGQGSLGMLSGHTIAMWFERRLGLAHALLAVLGFSLGSAALQLPTAFAIESLGWRNALLVLAAMVLLLVVPAALFLFKNRPEDVGQHLDGNPTEHATHDVLHGGTPPPGDPAFTVREAVRTRVYWTLLAPLVMTGLLGTALIFHMGPMLQQAGLAGSADQVASANMAWPIAFGGCTLVVGWLVDRYPARTLLPWGLALQCVGTLLCLVAARSGLGVAPTLALMVAGMSVYGASQAVIVGVCNPAIARYFGRTNHGAIRGTVSTAMVMGTGAGPFLVAFGADLLGDGTRDFTGPLLLCAATAVPLGVLSASIRPPDRTVDH